jgi:hypothetical protein
MMEAVLVIAALVRKFELRPAPQQPDFPQPAPLITLRPQQVPLLLTERV